MPYVGNTTADQRHMLDAIGLSSLEELFGDIPSRHRFPELPLAPAATEQEVIRTLQELGRTNAASGATCFAGGGVYPHFIPTVVDYLSSRGEFATAYTPYQAEASQGTLQAGFEYQTMISRLLGMEVVNASHYDASTAVAEAALMAIRSARGNRSRILVLGQLHPQHLEVAQTYLEPINCRIEQISTSSAQPGGGNQHIHADVGAALADDVAALIVQNPDYFGTIRDLSGLSELVHESGALFVIHTDPIAAAMLKAPGTYDPDIVTGEGQSLGIPMGFGGPYLGLFATTQKHLRKMPGRIIGQTQDKYGNRGFVLTLNTREQHIRRSKATSNICTNQALMALRATIHLAALGPQGLLRVAENCYQNTHYLASRLADISGCRVANEAAWFRDFILETPLPAEELVNHLSAAGIVAGIPLSRYFSGRDNQLLVSATEIHRKRDLDAYAAALTDAVHASDAAHTSDTMGAAAGGRE